MRRWARHLEALTRAVSGMGPSITTPESAEGGQEEGGQEAAVADEQEVQALSSSNESVPETAATANTSGEEVEPAQVALESLEQTLVRGMEVALGDLDQTAHGWIYRGHPVMVFAVDVAGVEDLNVRKEFFHRIHLASCCGALEDPAQPVWIGTAREALSAPGLEQPPHACEYCLAKVNHRGYRSLGPRDRGRVASALSFHWHVSQFADEFFSTDRASFWTPGKRPQPLHALTPEVQADSGTCGFCEWPVPSGKEWFVPVDRGVALGLAVDACILCAQQQAAGVLTLPENSALAASESRYRHWQAQVVEDNGEKVEETGERNWQRVRRQLPLDWHPLCEQLERKLAAPLLFHRFAGYEGVAVLAWPEHRRGIVASDNERDRLPEGWDFWTISGVLGSLG
ncbi:hypothetical protein [Microbulbifer celer]|uniref:Uncharacterized protein n=1 Tax=Microbulbifer celer TaxID=435905 RepID=A0ABW3UA13_9GAMM|nr:hypothetical protein [Microbulbifer celer]UFN56417.1 hypothetical protein LPW13_12655 [Microbulbifer celer]